MALGGDLGEFLGIPASSRTLTDPNVRYSGDIPEKDGK
jgi:hypothetical protein